MPDLRDDRKFLKSIHRVHNPRPKGPVIPLWMAVVLSILLVGAALAAHLLVL